MDLKYPWQGEWNVLKEKTLQALESPFPDPIEDILRWP